MRYNNKNIPISASNQQTKIVDQNGVKANNVKYESYTPLLGKQYIPLVYPKTSKLPPPGSVSESLKSQFSISTNDGKKMMWDPKTYNVDVRFKPPTTNQDIYVIQENLTNHMNKNKTYNQLDIKPQSDTFCDRGNDYEYDRYRFVPTATTNIKIPAIQNAPDIFNYNAVNNMQLSRNINSRKDVIRNSRMKNIKIPTIRNAPDNFNYDIVNNAQLSRNANSNKSVALNSQIKRVEIPTLQDAPDIFNYNAVNNTQLSRNINSRKAIARNLRTKNKSALEFPRMIGSSGIKEVNNSKNMQISFRNSRYDKYKIKGTGNKLRMLTSFENNGRR